MPTHCFLLRVNKVLLDQLVILALLDLLAHQVLQVSQEEMYAK